MREPLGGLPRALLIRSRVERASFRWLVLVCPLAYGADGPSSYRLIDTLERPNQPSLARAYEYQLWTWRSSMSGNYSKQNPRMLRRRMTWSGISLGERSAGDFKLEQQKVNWALHPSV